MLPPGTRIPYPHPNYGVGLGHVEIVREQFRGSLTAAVGCAICCCTCCPCGFCFPLDQRECPVWVVDGPPVQVSMVAPVGPAKPLDPAASVVGRTRVIAVRCAGPCGQVTQVSVHGETMTEFVCPRCGTRNRAPVPSEAVGPPSVPGTVAVAEAGLEEVELPEWWTTRPRMGESVLVSIANEDIEQVQKLFDRTWKEITTRDRGFKKPQRLQVVQAQRNFNPRLWHAYSEARRQIAPRMGAQTPVTFGTTQTMEEEGFTLGPLNPDINECFLFHGSRPSAVDNICKNNFAERLAGSHAGSLYGPGIYFGENSSKSDEYAVDDKSGIFSGLYAMLLCRVVCGRMVYNDEVNPDAQQLTQLCTGGDFDSILGDRAKARGTYREFVVFNSKQVYPELVVIYRRV